MKGLMLLADGFEDTEALTTRDVLIRAGFDIVTCSVKNEDAVISSFGVETKTDITFRSVYYDEYDFVILPGGGRGTRTLFTSEFVKETLKHFKDKYMYAICAAPMILGRNGYLENKHFTCFPGFEEGINGIYEPDKGVVVDGNVITAHSMFYSIEFALAIIEQLEGKEKANEVLIGLKGLEKKH